MTHAHPTPQPTFALTLETNNLRGGDEADAGRTLRALEGLFEKLAGEIANLGRPLEIVVTHDGLTSDERERLERKLGLTARWLRIGPEVGYYQAKNLAFDATTADVVAFADADCEPQAGWLRALLDPFTWSDASVVAGRTTYAPTILGAAASSIDFMYFRGEDFVPRGGGRSLPTTQNFYANNVAFRRAVFDRFRYRVAAGVYRGHCQKLGLALGAAGVPIVYVASAHTIHRFPDEVSELFRLRLLRGADTVELAPELVARATPWRPRPGSRSLGPALTVLGARFALAERTLGRATEPEAGLTFPLYPDAGSPVARRTRAAVAAITFADAAGAVAKAVLHRDLGVHDGGLRRGLGYHGRPARPRAHRWLHLPPLVG